MTSSTIRIGFILFFLAFSFSGFTQTNTPAAADTVREFEIIRAPSMRSVTLPDGSVLQTVAGGAIIKHDGTVFNCDSAVLNSTTHIIEAFGKIHINQGDTLHTYGDYLKYLGNEKMAYLTGNVKLTDGKGTLYTKDLDYNLESGIGNFYKGGRVVEKKNVITSLEGTYYADTKDVYFKKNVEMKGPKDTISADSLMYNMQTRKSHFISQTHIRNAEVDIHTTEGSYDLVSGDAFFTERTTVKDSSGRIYSANSMALEGVSGNGQLEGDAVIIDSANNFVLIANQIFLNKKNNSFLATRKPLLIVQQKNDSIYVAADTIYSGIKGSGPDHQKDILKSSNARQDQQIDSLILTDEGNPAAHPDTMSTPSKIPVTFDSISVKPDTSREVPAVILKTPVDSIKPDKDSLFPKIGTEPAKGDTAVTNLMNRLRQSDGAIKPKDTTNKGKTDTIAGNTSADSIKRESDSTARYFIAFHNVRIFSDSLQSVSDSLFFTTEDSVFRLYQDPVLWNGQSQITGDTIYLFTKNKEPERLYVFNNGMIVNRTREGFFNQMGGKTINAYFVDGKINHARVKGQQSESVHYMQDEDSAYIGMNRALGDIIDFYFKKEELQKVVFRNEIKGNMYPMNQIPEEEKRLHNFKWLDSRRPKSRFELLD